GAVGTTWNDLLIPAATIPYAPRTMHVETLEPANSIDGKATGREVKLFPITEPSISGQCVIKKSSVSVFPERPPGGNVVKSGTERWGFSDDDTRGGQTASKLTESSRLRKFGRAIESLARQRLLFHPGARLRLRFLLEP